MFFFVVSWVITQNKNKMKEAVPLSNFKSIMVETPAKVLESGRDFDSNDIHIEAGFDSLIDNPTQEELRQLEANILEEGCLEPLIVWDGDWVLIDGHNRYRICQKHELPFKIILKPFANVVIAKQWMINHQLGRRNLNDQQVRYYQGLQYNLSKQQRGGVRRGRLAKIGDEKQTDAQLAQEFNTSASSIRRAAAFYQGLENIAKHNLGLKHEILTKKRRIKTKDIEEIGRLSDQKLIKGIRNAEDVTKLAAQLRQEKKRDSRAKLLEAYQMTDEEKRIHEAQKVLEENEPAFVTKEQSIDRLRGTVVSKLREGIRNGDRESLHDAIRAIYRIEKIVLNTVVQVEL